MPILVILAVQNNHYPFIIINSISWFTKILQVKGCTSPT